MKLAVFWGDIPDAVLGYLSKQPPFSLLIYLSSIFDLDILLNSLPLCVVVVNFMSKFHWTKGCPERWSNIGFEHICKFVLRDLVKRPT